MHSIVETVEWNVIASVRYDLIWLIDIQLAPNNISERAFAWIDPLFEKESNVSILNFCNFATTCNTIAIDPSSIKIGK